ncbi:Gfo/Idh/MocA family oxidoreductase [Ruegeria sp. 2205SS24-7]|uniref:Gfo/Idh/MocA family protein n=1 Tax=Ruegeria discodermiae TaxID=3064389 RepID=UPI002740BDD8|nr:Gfo/Idh/MocA family oxidoreductase [Ruegeria sp. 2205SS24-7]MDP5219389.1 Gfo/Idh/MocA family oxidoreductase [Ruegeria sp. 2205SS24-7]
MTRQINYGIIGCGMMGQEHLKNIALLDGARAHAIFEPDAEMAEIARQIAPEALLVPSLDALLALPDLDCLLIVSPNHCHVEQVLQIAETRPLPLLIEKPLFTDPADAEAMMMLRDSYPAPIWVAMEYRYMPPIAAFLEQADAATGGIKMLTLREHRFPFLQKVGNWNRFNRNSGGTFVEKCCHFFDLMRLALGAEPVRVMASGAQSVNHLDERYDGEAPDILDNGYVIIDFNNGARAMLELCMFAEGATYQEEISAIGPTGKIEALVPGPGRFWPTHLGDPPTPKLIVSPRKPKGPVTTDVPVDETLLDAGDHNGSTFFQHQAFLQLLRGERDAPDVSLMDGWWAVRMGLAAQQSASSGESVLLEPVC